MAGATAGHDGKRRAGRRFHPRRVGPARHKTRAGGRAILIPGFYVQGVGGGTGAGPATGTVGKSAGPTISRYSMSGE